MIRAAALLVALAGCPKARETENENVDCPYPRPAEAPANGLVLMTSGVSGGSYAVFDADARSLRFRECLSGGKNLGSEETRVLASARAAALYALALEADKANNWTAPEYPDWGLSLTITKGSKRRQIEKNGEFSEGPAKQLLVELHAVTSGRW